MSDTSPDGTPAAPQGAAYPPVPPAPPAASEAETQPYPPAYGTPPAYGAAPSYGTPPAYGSAAPYGASAPAFGSPAAYGAPYYGGYAPAKTNTLAVVSLISSLVGIFLIPFLGSIVGVITGHMALSRLKTSGEQGRGLALAGTIIGWVGVGFGVLGLIALFAFIPFMIGVGTYYQT